MRLIFVSGTGSKNTFLLSIKCRRWDVSDMFIICVMKTSKACKPHFDGEKNILLSSNYFKFRSVVDTSFFTALMWRCVVPLNCIRD